MARIHFDHQNSSKIIGSDTSSRSKKENKYCFIIIKPNQGGLESKDFCGIVARIVEKYCNKNNITFEYIEQTEFILKLRVQTSGKVFSKLNGLHKLVRISPFGKGDKVHTSLCKVNVLNPPPQFNIKINESDLRIDFFKSTGPGGQHRNKTMSAVRLLHIPTGTIVTSDSSRSQHDNRKYAYDLLACKLEEIWEEKKDKDRIENRKLESQKEIIVISYYFNHQFVINEVTGTKTTSLKNVLNGDISLIA